MSLSRLLIKDFRNIEQADLALSPGFNFLVGANGSGKTSVLEAIYTLGHGRAFRSLQIGRVIRHEQDAFVLHGRLQGEERETAIGLTKDKQGDSKVRIDGTDGHKVAELAHLMPMQLSPDFMIGQGNIHSVREGLNFFRGPDNQHQWRVSRILCCQLPA